MLALAIENEDIVLPWPALALESPSMHLTDAAGMFDAAPCGNGPPLPAGGRKVAMTFRWLPVAAIMIGNNL